MELLAFFSQTRIKFEVILFFNKKFVLMSYLVDVFVFSVSLLGTNNYNNVVHSSTQQHHNSHENCF